MAQNERTRERLWDAYRDSMIEDDLASAVAAVPDTLNADVTGCAIFSTLPVDMTIKQALSVWVNAMHLVPGYARQDGLYEADDKGCVALRYTCPILGQYSGVTVSVFVAIQEKGICRRVQIGTRMEKTSVEIAPAKEEDQEIPVPIFKIVCDEAENPENVA